MGGREEEEEEEEGSRKWKCHEGFWFGSLEVGETEGSELKEWSV